MKTIGLLGGVSWHSTISYYKRLNEIADQTYGQNSSAKCHIVSVNFAEVVANNDRNDHNANAKLVESACLSLERSGAEAIGICANTIHMYLPYFQDKLSIPVIHIGQVTATEADTKGFKSVGLMGTRYVMQGDFYLSKLTEAGLRVELPNPEEQELLHNAIYNELTRGLFLQETSEKLCAIARGLAERCDAVALACTELPLVINPDNAKSPLLDTTEIHVQALARFALGERI